MRTLAVCRVMRIRARTGRHSTVHPKVGRFRHGLLGNGETAGKSGASLQAEGPRLATSSAARSFSRYLPKRRHCRCDGQPRPGLWRIGGAGRTSSGIDGDAGRYIRLLRGEDQVSVVERVAIVDVIEDLYVRR